MRPPKRSYLILSLALLASFVVGLQLQPAHAASQDAPPTTQDEQEEPAAEPDSEKEFRYVSIETNHGLLVLELNQAKAPKTVENFMTYVEDRFYDNTMIHRLTKRGIYVLQGGGFSVKGQKKPVRAPIVNEYRNGLKNDHGTISMARTRNPDSATSQFFLNYRDNNQLDEAHAMYGGAAYCVFGKIVVGLDLIEKLSKIPTGRSPVAGMAMNDVPLEPLTFEKVREINKERATKLIEAEEEAKKPKKDGRKNDKDNPRKSKSAE